MKQNLALLYRLWDNLQVNTLLFRNRNLDYTPNIQIYCHKQTLGNFEVGLLNKCILTSSHICNPIPNLVFPMTQVPSFRIYYTKLILLYTKHTLYFHLILYIYRTLCCHIDLIDKLHFHQEHNPFCITYIYHFDLIRDSFK